MTTGDHFGFFYFWKTKGDDRKEKLIDSVHRILGDFQWGWAGCAQRITFREF